MTENWKAQDRPLNKAYEALVRALSSLPPPPITQFWDQHDFRNVADHVEDFARACDRYLRAIGEEAKSQSTGFSLVNFTDVFRNSIEGQATYDLEAAAKEIEESNAAILNDPRGWTRAKFAGVD